MNTKSVTLEYIKFTQHIGGDCVNKIDSYDILVTCSSTEPRCLALIDHLQTSTKFSKFIILSSSDMRFQTEESVNLEMLMRFAKCKSLSINVMVESFSKKWKSLIDMASHEIVESAINLGRPVTVALDISCMPKPIFLGLISSGIRVGYIRRVGALYFGASYQTFEGDIGAIGEDDAFSRGTWRPALIPFLEGEVNPGKQRTIIASIGFEAMKSRVFIRSYQPDHCVFIKTPSKEVDGRAHDLGQLLNDKNNQLLADYEHDSRNNVEIMPMDSIKVIHHLYDMAKYYSDDDLILFCLGTKPHALAMGVFSLLNSTIPAIPRVPEDFIPMKNIHNGECALFLIEDLSAI